MHISKVTKMVREQARMNKHKVKKLRVFTKKLLTQRMRLIVANCTRAEGSYILQFGIPEILMQRVL